MEGETYKKISYRPGSPTLEAFHKSRADIRCIVGPVGSGKTSAAAMEVGYYLPRWLARHHGIRQTRWVVVRNTYDELMSTTFETIKEWLPGGEWHAVRREYILRYPMESGIPFERVVVLWLRACDQPGDLKKFKSLEVTGYWGDESVELEPDVKRILKTRIGRFPPRCPSRFGIETTNPCSLEDPMYWEFEWQTEVPGPAPKRRALENHVGWWQPEGDNAANLRPGFYEDLRKDFAGNPDWIDMYIRGMPGRRVEGRLVYQNFVRGVHVAPKRLALHTQLDEYSGALTVSPAYMGWDNSGTNPAAVLVQLVGPGRLWVLREYQGEAAGIVDFGRQVMTDILQDFPGLRIRDHWGDPAGETRYSKQDGGGLTSNAELMRQTLGINVRSSEQNPVARQQSVDQLLARRDGLLVDGSCTKSIDGFTATYVWAQKPGHPGEYLPVVVKNRWVSRTRRAAVRGGSLGLPLDTSESRLPSSGRLQCSRRECGPVGPSEVVMNIIHMRDRPDEKEFRPIRGQRCPWCDDPGEYYGMLDGRRVFFCKAHHRKYIAMASKDVRIMESL